MAQHTLKHTLTDLALYGAIYLRISFDKHSDEAGVQRQQSDALDLAQREAITITDDLVIIDNDITAKGTRTRPGFERLLSAAESGLVRVIICYKIDRLTRNPRDTGRLLDAGMRHKITVIETGGARHELWKSAGRLPFTILAAAAAFENEVKSERMKRKNQATRAAGKIAGGRQSFGYTKDMIIIEDQAEALRFGYKALLDGWSCRAIARHWNDQGIRTSTGVEWGTGKVSAILKNARNAGILTFDGEEIGQGDWQPIIDEATWHAALLILNDPARLTAHGAKRLLTGIARCGIDGCGALINAGGANHGGVKPVYSCTAQRHLARQAVPVEEYVTGAVLERLALPDAHDLTLPAQEDPTAALYARKRQLDVDLGNQAELLSLQPRMKNAVHRTISKISAEIDEIDAALARHATSRATNQLAGLVDAQDIWAHWSSLSMDVQRMIIDTLVEIVIMPSPRGSARTFDPDKIKITFKS